MARHKNCNWNVEELSNGMLSRDQIMIVLMMDLRDELQRLNCLLNCENFRAIPKLLRTIKDNTTKRRKPRLAKSAS